MKLSAPTFSPHPLLLFTKSDINTEKSKRITLRSSTTRAHRLGKRNKKHTRLSCRPYMLQVHSNSQCLLEIFFFWLLSLYDTASLNTTRFTFIANPSIIPLSLFRQKVVIKRTVRLITAVSIKFAAATVCCRRVILFFKRSREFAQDGMPER